MTFSMRACYLTDKTARYQNVVLPSGVVPSWKMTMDINVMQSLSQDKSSQAVDEVLGMHNHNLTITIRAYFITCWFF